MLQEKEEDTTLRLRRFTLEATKKWASIYEAEDEAEKKWMVRRALPDGTLGVSVERAIVDEQLANSMRLSSD